jgi:uncharacterized OsmC-like protein
VTTAVEVTAKRPRSPDLGGRSKPALLTRRAGKLGFGALLLAAGLLTFYQQLVVRASRDAVINARVAVIRAPIDGIATAAVTAPGMAMRLPRFGGRLLAWVITAPFAGGSNIAANPVEYSLAALGSCQAITYRVWAAQLGIQLDKVEISIDGDIDLRGFFGIDERIRAGFNAVRVNVSLSGPEPAARYEELAAAVDAHCPVLDLFRNPVPVERKLVSIA